MDFGKLSVVGLETLTEIIDENPELQEMLAKKINAYLEENITDLDLPRREQLLVMLRELNWEI